MAPQKIVSLTVTICSLAAATCWAQGDKLMPCRELATTFFAKSAQQMQDEFKAYELDMQFTIYICSTQYMHPPLLEFADWFAARGQPTADYLRDKLMHPTDDETTRDIVRVLAFMVIRRSYDVTGDLPLMRLLDSRIAGIVDSDVKAHSQMLLAQLRQR